MILRTWGCKNRRCRNEWTGDGDHPPCPRCGSLQVQWIPGGFNIAKKSPGYDRTIKTLTDRAGMTDMNDPRAGERAKPKPPSPVGSNQFAVTGYDMVDGHRIPRLTPTCGPNGMTDKVAVPLGGRFTDGAVAVPVKQGDRVVQAKLAGPTPQVVARHKG